MPHASFIPVRAWPLALLLTLAGARPAAAQQPAAAPSAPAGRLTLSGTVQDAQTGESLTGATVRVVERPGVGTGANAYGFYSLTAPAGLYTVEASFVGYAPQRQRLSAAPSQRLDFKLAPGGPELQEVVVTARSAEATISKAQMGVETLDLKQVAKVPVLFGERDVIKTLTLLPGVKSAGEGSSGFAVRGGKVDQNLILLDEAPVYNASHLLGFFSTFNSDAIRDLTIYKGGMPAQYGGRLSSVVDIRMKEGNSQALHGSGGIGLIASRLALEGPLAGGRGSFLVAGRRTYADLFLKLSPTESTRNSSLYFYDLNAKANYRLGERDRLFFSAYLGQDVLGFGGNFENRYGNQTATLRLNHLFSDRLFSNTSLIFSKYDFRITLSEQAQAFDIDSKIQDLNLKQDFEFTPGTGQTLRFGGQAIYHTITPGHVTAAAESGVNSTPAQTNYSLETAAYVSHEWQASPRLNFTYGLRLSAFSLLGPGTYRTYDAAGRVLSSTTYTRADGFLKTYVRLEPRLAASYQLGGDATLKFSYARNVQNLHLLTNSTGGLPTDLYQPTTFNVQPETADQLSLGYFRPLGTAKTYSLGVETYYKDLRNQVDYRDGTQLQGNLDVEASLLYGRGRAYGVELLLRKDAGRLTGWLGYTLSRSERQFDQINGGAWFRAGQDQPHDVSVVGIYQLTPRWNVSGTFVASTGRPATFPVGKYQVAGQVVSRYGLRNADRLPHYQRLDLGATYDPGPRPGRRWHGSWTFSLYNALGRENTYSLRFEPDPTDATRTRAVQTALFRWVPSATYNFSF